MDSRLDRAFVAVAAIESPDSETTQAWLENCRESFSKMINEKLENDAKEREKKEEKPKSQADDLIDFYHLKSRRAYHKSNWKMPWRLIYAEQLGLTTLTRLQTPEIPN